jgi:predicted SAM-dependent methyltransferase
MQVDLGCGKSKVKGVIGIDADPNSDADIICKLGAEPIPLEDSSVDKVTATQFFEHLDNPIPVLNECCRILKNNGVLFIEVPHYSNYIAHGLGHKQYYSHKEIVRILKHDLNYEIEIIKAEITFYKSFRLAGIHYLANRFPTNYERFWAYIFPAENLKITAKVKK